MCYADKQFGLGYNLSCGLACMTRSSASRPSISNQPLATDGHLRPFLGACDAVFSKTVRLV